MKMLRAAILVAAVFGASAAQAQKVELSKLTCEEFLKQDKDTIGALMMWLSGYYMGNDDDPVIDFDKMANQGKELGAFCAANGGAKLSEAAEKIMGK